MSGLAADPRRQCHHGTTIDHDLTAPAAAAAARGAAGEAVEGAGEVAAGPLALALGRRATAIPTEAETAAVTTAAMMIVTGAPAHSGIEIGTENGSGSGMTVAAPAPTTFR